MATIRDDRAIITERISIGIYIYIYIQNNNPKTIQAKVFCTNNRRNKNNFRVKTLIEVLTSVAC